MDAQTTWAEPVRDDRAVRFTGTWQEYLPIAATNVLLIIVTLGIYRFWAAARERRYLWSRTRFIDDHLEWTGTGKEMFVGFLVALLFLLPFILFVQFLFPALVARGHAAAAGLLMLGFYLGVFYLVGFARFRALRYRLSRTWWHGIRGGSDDPGWRFGALYLGRHAVAAATMFTLFPWAATQLWNDRWNRMSFGPHRFRAELTAQGLILRWALLYLVPVIGMIGFAGVAVGFLVTGGEASPSLIAVAVGIVVLFYFGIPLLTLAWFAAFYRRAAEDTALGELRFGFDATVLQWLGLFLGNLALAIVTLGFGIAYWGYRNWAFIVRHLHVYGEIDLAALTQTTTRAPSEAEGFADAFDIGAL